MAAWVVDAVRDLRYALRTWGREPGYVAVAVLSLAAGIGLNTAVFSVVNTIFLQGVQGVPEPHRVATIGPRAPLSTLRTVREHSRTLDGVAAWQPVGVNLRVGDLVMRAVVPVVSDDYLEVLRVKPVLGRGFAPSGGDTPSPEAVLDYEFWARRLGRDPGILGGTVTLNGTPAVIVGVAPREFHGFGPERPALWVTLGRQAAIGPGAAPPVRETDATWRLFGRVAPNATLGDVQAELHALATRDRALFGDVRPTAATGAERWTGPVSEEKRIEFLLVVVLPLVVVGLILWIGCSNVANLLLARASARRRELAVRLASGASRSRLVRLLLAESLTLAAAGGVVGLLVATWTIDLVWLTLPELPPLAVEIDGTVLLYTAFISVLATVFFGTVPALHATRLDVAPLLKGEPGGSGHAARGARMRTFFLVTQFASSMALLITAGTFVRAVIETHRLERSAAFDQLALAQVETQAVHAASREEFWRSLREQVLAHPVVSALTVLRPQGTRGRLVPDGRIGPEAWADVAIQQVDADYFAVGEIPVLHGTARLDILEPGGAVINARLARQFWGTTDVTGRRFSLPDAHQPFRIAGVVDDDGAEPRVFVRLVEGELLSGTLLIRTHGPSAGALEAIRSLLVQISGDQVLTRVSTLREARSGGLQRITRLAVVIAAVVLTLASIGLYGSISFSTSQRTREIAIRLAVGAPRVSVLRLLATHAALVVAAGSILGLILTGIAYRFMAGMFFSAWRLEPLTVAGVAAALALATAAACYVPARRALRVDPMAVLRTE